MSLSYYEIAVPTFRQGLTGLSQVLAKAEAYFAEQGRDTAELMGDKLSPDMLPFAIQISLTVSHSKGAMDRLSGKEAPLARHPGALAEARELVGSALAALDSFSEADLAGAETQQIPWNPVPQVNVTFNGGRAYLLGFALPNFYFHASMAYAIVRKNGVPIGKDDFLGRVRAPANA